MEFASPNNPKFLGFGLNKQERNLLKFEMMLNRSSILGIVTALIAYLSYEFFFRIEYSPIVQTSSGSVRGFVSRSRLGKEYYNFLGIQYAQSPVRELRFANPVAAQSWSGVKDALNFGSKCVQVDGLSRTITADENCLFLNIFVPKGVIDSTKLLPVIFYIHGGYFMVGSSSYMGADYLMDEDIILITLNYRLNIFGFLNTEDKTSRGNFGLKDQHLALQWTHQNIQKFGGDSSKVTIAGQSAGSAAVHFHLLSPRSHGLFSGAIMSSGTAIKPWSLVRNPRAQAHNLAKQVNCPTQEDKLVDCLRSIDAADIVKAQIHALDSPLMDPLEIFAPSIEICTSNDPECFLSSHPYDILEAGNAARVPVLTGINSEEGLLVTARIFVNSSLENIVETNWDALSSNLFLYDNSRLELTKRIRNFYIGDEGNGKLNFQSKFQNITDALSDRLYIHATREAVKIQSQFSSVYLYYFNYPLKRGLTYLYDIDPYLPVIPQFIWKEIKWHIKEYIFHQENPCLGVGHGDDLALVFKFPVIYLSPGSKDFAMSRAMVKMWTDFAKDPNRLNFNGNNWPPIRKNASQLRYMLISNNNGYGSMIEEPFAERMKFWDDVNLPWKL